MILYCFGGTVAQAILDSFLLTFVHILTMENTAITRVLAVKNIAAMLMVAYVTQVNIIIRLFLFLF